MREGDFLSRLCRESLLTPGESDTLLAVAHDGFLSWATASRRVRGLGRSPKDFSAMPKIGVGEMISEGGVQPDVPQGHQARGRALGVRRPPFVGSPNSCLLARAARP